MKEKQLLYRLSILWRKIFIVKNHTCWFQRHGGVHESIHKWWVESVLKAIHFKFWCIHSRQFAKAIVSICINFMFHTFFLRNPLPGFRDDLFVFANWNTNWPTCLLDTFIVKKRPLFENLMLTMLTQGSSIFGTKFPEVSLIWKLKVPFILLFRPMALKGTRNVKIELLNQPGLVMTPCLILSWPALKGSRSLLRPN